MATSTAIEWTDVTWNPVRGCARVSAGCEHCYAERVAYRFGRKPGSPYEGLTVLGKQGPRWNGRARFVPELLDAPLRWKKPRRVFVNSMSDLFHDDITDKQIAAVFGVMAACRQHTFQVLTKRPERMLRWFEWLRDSAAGPYDPPPAVACGLYAANHCTDVDYLGLSTAWPLPNVWLGVSCEDQQAANYRIPLLRRCPAEVHFISAEPLLGPIALDDRWLEWLPTGPDENDESHLLPPLRWVILGGESGSRARPCRMSWIEAIVRECDAARVPCFVKQLGAEPWEDRLWRGIDQDMGLTDRKGGDSSEWPADLRVRQFPEMQ